MSRETRFFFTLEDEFSYNLRQCLDLQKMYQSLVLELFQDIMKTNFSNMIKLYTQNNMIITVLLLFCRAFPYTYLSRASPLKSQRGTFRSLDS